MSFESRPIKRSRTQPPTMSARPPVSRTAVAMARARSSGLGMLGSARDRLAAELLHDPVAEPWRERVQQDESAGLLVWINLGHRTRNRPRDGFGDLIGGLPGSL